MASAPARGRASRRPAGHRLHVGVVGHSAQMSGGELALVRLLPAVLSEVDVTVVLAEHGPLVDRLRSLGVPVEVLAMPNSARGLGRDLVRPGIRAMSAAVTTTAYVLRLARRLRRIHIDVVHTNSLKAAVYGGLAGRVLGVPCVWHVRDRIEADYLPAAAVRLVRGLARVLPAAIVTDTHTVRDTLHLRDERQCRVIPSPVDVAALSAVPAPGPGSPTMCVMVGRIAPWKGQDVFLKAFAAAFPDGPERGAIVGAALFGEDDLEVSLRQLAATLGVADRVEFRGHRADLVTELHRATILVHASTIPEPFGQVVVEGMAAGLPVVAATAGGPTEFVRDDVNGLLTPPGDVEALAAALRRLAADPALRARLGSAGRSGAPAYAAEAVAPRIVELYQTVTSHQFHYVD